MSSSRSLPSRKFGFAASLLITLTLLLVGCAEPTVDQMRAGYTVELNSWMAQPVEAPAQMMDEEMDGDEAAMEDEDASEMMDDEMTDDEMVEGGMAEGGMMAEDAMAETAEPQMTSILFDVVVRYDGLKPLPGLTLDISHADSSQQEKAVYHHWVDTSSLLKGEPYQESFKIEVPFAEGDLFSVAIRESVPEAERGAYQEYSSAP